MTSHLLPLIGLDVEPTAAGRAVTTPTAMADGATVRPAIKRAQTIAAPRMNLFNFSPQLLHQAAHLLGAVAGTDVMFLSSIRRTHWQHYRSIQVNIHAKLVDRDTFTPRGRSRRTRLPVESSDRPGARREVWIPLLAAIVSEVGATLSLRVATPGRSAEILSMHVNSGGRA